ncbi:sn-glycerol-3-phosphate ABC transporter permease UgpA [Caldisericum sp.]|uniref:sn-glycerol-3-phosphate ABC transporter permease UgpA n=1 Tax=Caldisericum sp. TaxID=2499687 RepID=UPI003D0FFF60
MEDRPVFSNKILPYLLIIPQLIFTIIFFLWPAIQSIYQSMLRADPFGLHVQFVGLANFVSLLTDKYYLHSIWTSIIFSTAVTLVALPVALLLAVEANKPIYGSKIFRTLIIWPYALAPAVAAVLWLFLFQPSIGILARFLQQIGIRWDYTLNGRQALLIVILVSAWKQVSYNFIFFLAGLQSIPKSLVEAAEMDGANFRRIFWSVTFPLLSPTTFFLLIMNLVYAFFETFGVIDALTKGGPAKATEIMVYKVYMDGIVNFNISSSTAQSVILLILVSILTAFQFRFIERRVHYWG